MQIEKIQAIWDWPQCNTLTKLRTYLNACGYYRRFVKVFSTISAPLYALTKKGIKNEWTPNRQRAFETFKLRLISSVFLLYKLTKKPTYSTVMRATMASEPYSPKSSPELRQWSFTHRLLVTFSEQTRATLWNNSKRAPCYRKQTQAVPSQIDKETYILDCDASNYGFGAVFSHEQSGIERVIVYSSLTRHVQ